MVQSTSPDAIAMWDNGDPTSIVQESQTQGASIQAALSKRERFDFVWANSAERTAQTGMVQGSRGYQVDTKSEYIYDNSAWRLSLSFIRFSGTGNMATSGTGWIGPANLTLDAAASTDSGMATIGASGSSRYIRLVNPGVYTIQWTSVISANVGALAQFSSTTGTTDPLAIVDSVTNNTNTNLYITYTHRSTAANQDIYMHFFQNSGGTPSQVSSVSAIRLG